jgi:uncharacterized phiE125 gp8 family phage protein
MNMLSHEALSLGSDMLDEAKAYLRLETDDEDAPLGAILLAAIGHAEAFTQVTLIRRGVTEIRPASPEWQRLSATPVASVTAIAGIPADGARFVLPPANYSVDIDNNGDGYVRVMQQGAAGRVEIAYQAGIAFSWAQLPEALRMGILRLTGHLHLHRDAADDPGPPAAVAALLRPWRRMRLS